MQNTRASTGRFAWRAVMAAALLMIACAITAARVWQIPHPLGDFGLGFDNDETTVNAVAAGSSAAAAGVRAGDRIERAGTSPYDMYAILGRDPPLPGQIASVRFNHAGAQRSVVLKAQSSYISLGDAIQIVTYYFGVLLFVAIAGVLMVLRPSRMMYAFFAIAASLAINPLSELHRPASMVVPAIFIIDLSAAAIGSALMIFIARFPNDRASGIAAWLDRIAIPYAILNAGLLIYHRLSGRPPTPGLLMAETAMSMLPLIAVAILLAFKFLRLRGSDRQRLAWVTASFLLYSLAFIPQQGVNAPPVSLQIISNLTQMLVPIAVAYAVIKHRVIDIRFAISRALVYTVLTSCVVGFFALLDWGIGTALAQTGIALVVSIGVSIAVGYWLHSLHRSVDRTIDRILFRARHEAAQRLARVAAGLRHAYSGAAISTALVDEPVQALRLASAALFRRDGDESFERVAANGWPEDGPTHIGDGDALLLHLQGERGALRLRGIHTDGSFAAHALDPIMALPVFVSERLEAFALYGAHTGGEDLDPDEVQSLDVLSTAAAVAYEHMRAKDLEDALARARAAESELRSRLQASNAPPHL